MLTLEELGNLPDKLLKELRITDSKMLDIVIYSFIKDSGEVNVDQILLHLFKAKGIILARNRLVSRLYRLGQRGIVTANGKGVYRIKESQNEMETNIDSA